MDESLRALGRAQDEDAGLRHALALARTGRVPEALLRLEQAELGPAGRAEAAQLQDALWRAEVARLAPARPLGEAAEEPEAAGVDLTERLAAWRVGDEVQVAALSGLPIARLAPRPDARLLPARGRVFLDADGGDLLESVGLTAEGAVEHHALPAPGARLLSVDPAGERALLGYDLLRSRRDRWPRARSNPRWALVSWPDGGALLADAAPHGAPLVDWETRHVLVRATERRLEPRPFDGAPPRPGLEVEGPVQVLCAGVLAEGGRGLTLRGPGWSRRLVERGEATHLSLRADRRALRLVASQVGLRFELDLLAGTATRTGVGPAGAAWHPRADLLELAGSVVALDGAVVLAHPGAQLLAWAPGGRAALLSGDDGLLWLWRIPD